MPVSIARMKEVLNEESFEDFYTKFKASGRVYEIVNVFDVLDWLTTGEVKGLPATAEETMQENQK